MALEVLLVQERHVEDARVPSDAHSSGWACPGPGAASQGRGVRGRPSGTPSPVGGCVAAVSAPQASPGSPVCGPVTLDQGPPVTSPQPGDLCEDSISTQAVCGGTGGWTPAGPFLGTQFSSWELPGTLLPPTPFLVFTAPARWPSLPPRRSPAVVFAASGSPAQPRLPPCRWLRGHGKRGGPERTSDCVATASG